jgi:hypothetical protein
MKVWHDHSAVKVEIAALVQAKVKIKNCRILIRYLEQFTPTFMGLRLLSFMTKRLVTPYDENESKLLTV